MDNLSIKNLPNPRLLLRLLSNQSSAALEALHSTEMFLLTLSPVRSPVIPDRAFSEIETLGDCQWRCFGADLTCCDLRFVRCHPSGSVSEGVGGEVGEEGFLEREGYGGVKEMGAALYGDNDGFCSELRNSASKFWAERASVWQDVQYESLESLCHMKHFASRRESPWKLEGEASVVSSKLKLLQQELLNLERIGKSDLSKVSSRMRKQTRRYQALAGKIDNLCRRMIGGVLGFPADNGSYHVLTAEAQKTIHAVSYCRENNHDQITFKPDVKFMRDYGDLLEFGGDLEWTAENDLVIWFRVVDTVPYRPLWPIATLTEQIPVYALRHDWLRREKKRSGGGEEVPRCAGRK
ncbi:hypothetical protein RHSIM_Rhsim03G0260800 [Rhododendron simsii]|uniref:Uncharacterized protein n=1 Tax=Rhododendron simsii TaxID=118357 RepID=A0A834H7X8_RHOSS|nr:hypothetical protein RHSIM_Rhsim03G0260800 [Rhododendron simsii]